MLIFIFFVCHLLYSGAVCCYVCADGPKVPEIAANYYMDNWRSFCFNWSHGDNDPNTPTNYYAWFRSGFVLVNLLVTYCCLRLCKEDCQTRQLNKKDAADHSKWRKLIKDIW